MRKNSFRRAENLSNFRGGTYEGVSLLELSPGGGGAHAPGPSTNAYTNYTAEVDENGESGASTEDPPPLSL